VWSRDRIAIAVAALLVALTTALYLDSLAGDFLNWDDRVWVIENPQITKPLPEAAATVLTTFHFHNYTPLPRLAHLVQWKIAGRNAMVFRLTNLVLHVVASFLLYLLLAEWLGRRLPAAAVAILFAVHPGNVENVAWISETNSLMAGGLAFGAALAWLKCGEERVPIAALVLFVLALLAKSTVLGLPVLLVLLDVSRRRKLALRRYAPFLLCSAVFGALQVLAASGGEGIKGLQGGGPVAHAATVVAVLPRYAAGALWPWGHAPHHLFPPVESPADPRLWLGVCLLAAGALACRLSWRGERRLLVAVPWFLLAVLTVLVVPIPIVLADRFLYVAMPLLLAAGVDLALPHRSRALWPGRIAVAAVVVLMAVSTADYQRAWRSSTTLWERNVASYPRDRLAWETLGALRLNVWDHDGSVEAFRRVVEIDPDYRYGWERLAIAEGIRGRADESEAIFTRLIDEDPCEPSVWFNLAGVRDHRGDEKGARLALEAGLGHCPEDPLLTGALEALAARKAGSP
jgi:hypothetical protein